MLVAQTWARLLVNRAYSMLANDHIMSYTVVGRKVSLRCPPVSVSQQDLCWKCSKSILILLLPATGGQ